MQTTAMLMVLAFAGAQPAEMTPVDASQALIKNVETGSLIFTQGDCLAVKVFTQSPYTHVAAVCYEDGTCYVFESTNGVGVRKMAFDRYIKLQEDATVLVAHPKRDMSAADAKTFQKHLTQELGRPYGIKHHLTGNRADGLHCAEYVTDALMSVGRINAEKPPRVSPASLRKGLLDHDIYEAGQVIRISRVESVRPEPETWCGRMWQDTVDCTQASCRKLSGWFLCR